MPGAAVRRGVTSQLLDLSRLLLDRPLQRFDTTEQILIDLALACRRPGRQQNQSCRKRVSGHCFLRVFLSGVQERDDEPELLRRSAIGPLDVVIVRHAEIHRPPIEDGRSRYS